MLNNHRILITGARGYVGGLLFRLLKQDCDNVWGIDVRPTDDVTEMDIRDPGLVDLLLKHDITHVVHLASIVQPGQDPDVEYDIDVNGTKNVLEGCVNAGVTHLTVTSSGAAYGYHADSPEWLTEDDPVRGNDEFSYSRHKRLVEEMLAEYRRQSPELAQLVLRPGTVIGANTQNMITRLFTGHWILGLRGVRSPFVFAWDQDLVETIAYGVEQSRTGIFNVAGDGCLSVAEIGELMNKPVIHLPVWLVKSILAVTKPLRITRYGPDQVRFMQYRPVLSNDKLKTEFGRPPTKSSRQALEFFIEHLPGPGR
ncbi:MAG: SDR family oxidoreductase [Pirellulaceae bacterium]|nr:SDR family oxidoreductase [Pirellulaceae bacterium]